MLSASVSEAKGVLAAALHYTSYRRRSAKRKPMAKWGRGEGGGAMLWGENKKDRQRASAKGRRERKSCDRKGHGLRERIKKHNHKHKPQGQTFRNSQRLSKSFSMSVF